MVLGEVLADIPGKHRERLVRAVPTSTTAALAVAIDVDIPLTDDAAPKAPDVVPRPHHDATGARPAPLRNPEVNGELMDSSVNVPSAPGLLFKREHSAEPWNVLRQLAKHRSPIAAHPVEVRHVFAVGAGEQGHKPRFLDFVRAGLLGAARRLFKRELAGAFRAFLFKLRVGLIDRRTGPRIRIIKVPKREVLAALPEHMLDLPSIRGLPDLVAPAMLYNLTVHPTMHNIPFHRQSPKLLLSRPRVVPATPGSLFSGPSLLTVEICPSDKSRRAPRAPAALRLRPVRAGQRPDRQPLRNPQALRREALRPQALRGEAQLPQAFHP